jgi:hypothetical protein
MGLRIDRATFLGLTFGMAACNPGPGPAVSANVIDIPKQPDQLPDAGTPALGKPEPEKPLVIAPTDDDDDDFGMPTDEDGNTVTLTAACGFVDPKTVTRPAAGSCNDAQGPTPSCAAMKACPSFPFPRQQCESYRQHFQPKAAQRAIDCLSKLTQKQVCDDACNTYRCGDRALKTSCPDASADAMCRVLVGRCKSVQLSECTTYFSGLNAVGRVKVMSCMTARGGCGTGLFSCTEGL